MHEKVFYIPGSHAVGRFAAQYLNDQGIITVFSPGPDVTHLLLPVPSFEADGRIRGIGNLWHILGDLPRTVTVIGGNLYHPALEGYHTVDLLGDPYYLAENAAITAHCAICLAAKQLPVILKDCPVLLIGWGRIGKCLAALLKNAGASVTVGARKAADRATLEALGYKAVEPDKMGAALGRFRVIFNTAPATVLREEQVPHLRPDCLCIDLATVQGLPGRNVIHARGLPGKDAPESSGTLIAQRALALLAERGL